MPDESNKTDDGDVDAGKSSPDDDSGLSDRPTVAPPFDLETYAREATASSSAAPEKAAPSSLEQRIDLALLEGSEPPSTTNTEETKPPPAAQAFAPVQMAREPPSERQTPRGMQKLEEARALSARADPAREQKPRLVPGSLLSLANMQVPSGLPPRAPPDDPVVTLVGVEDVPDSAPAIEIDPQSEMQERFALGDFSGALVMAESLLDENPTHVEAREYAESCRAVLQQMYTARIGSLDRVPVVEVARDQLRWLSIDHRAGFVLSLVDGISSLEMILDVSGMPSLDALRILFELVEQRIISFRNE